jgi:hypothetical protein
VLYAPLHTLLGTLRTLLGTLRTLLMTNDSGLIGAAETLLGSSLACFFGGPRVVRPSAHSAALQPQVLGLAQAWSRSVYSPSINRALWVLYVVLWVLYVVLWVLYAL